MKKEENVLRTSGAYLGLLNCAANNRLAQLMVLKVRLSEKHTKFEKIFFVHLRNSEL